MIYSEMIQEAKAKGLATEKVMWDSMEDLEELLCRMKKEHPKEYWMFLRKQHGRLFRNHYDEKFAEHDVEHLMWTDREVHKHNGAYWSCSQIKEATKGMVFPSGTTDHDKYVAYNVTKSDLCKVLDDEHILKVAHAFWFADEDFDGEGKIWVYMKALCEHEEKEY